MDITRRLISWYLQNKRPMPWRETKNPYFIWLSEVILQQTRVAQGMSYYYRFIEKFPDVQALANATEDEVLSLWQGLGYYSRARNLHQAAKEINEKYKGVFPDTYKDIRALKGVGDYTAAAISSIVYNLPYAVVDGNVYRVLSRFFNTDTPIDSTKGKKEFAAMAQELLDVQNPGDFNQAIMELGATICTKHSPLCTECPLMNDCLALAKNTYNELPVKAKKTKVSALFYSYIYIHDDQQVWMRKRTGDTIWKGLYEFPLIETVEPVGFEEIAQSSEYNTILDELVNKDSAYIITSVPLEYTHLLSHRKITARFYAIKASLTNYSESGFVKINIAHLAETGKSTLIQRYLEKRALRAF